MCLAPRILWLGTFELYSSITLSKFLQVEILSRFMESIQLLQSTRFTHERTTSNIHKIFHSPIWFFNYEMILRTFNCTIVNQIKSSKKLVVKLKIRNLQLLQMKTIFKLFFGRVPLFSRGNKWATVSPPHCVFKICARSLVVSCIKTQDV